MSKRSYSPGFKLQVVLEAFQSNSTDAKGARTYDIFYPVMPSIWKVKFEENGNRAFGAAGGFGHRAVG